MCMPGRGKIQGKALEFPAVCEEQKTVCETLRRWDFWTWKSGWIFWLNNTQQGAGLPGRQDTEWKSLWFMHMMTETWKAQTWSNSWAAFQWSLLLALFMKTLGLATCVTDSLANSCFIHPLIDQLLIHSSTHWPTLDSFIHSSIHLFDNRYWVHLTFQNGYITID